MGAATRGFIAEEVGVADNTAASTSTLSGQSGILHDQLASLENAVDLLEKALGPVLMQWPNDGGTEGEVLESLPPAVDSIRQAGFRVASLRRRLEDVRARLAIQ